MKTKYIKVLTADQLPEETGIYITNLGSLLFYVYEGEQVFKSLRSEKIFSISQIEFWFYEIPDREEEMMEMLEELVTHHFDFMGCGEIKELQKKAEHLLNELRNKP